MTRKDYELIASILSNSDEIIDEYALEALAENFAEALAKENPRFNSKIFIARATWTSAKREALYAQLQD